MNTPSTEDAEEKKDVEDNRTILDYGSPSKRRCRPSPVFIVLMVVVVLVAWSIIAPMFATQ